MKRPTIALLSILFLLALGLAVTGPRTTQAGSLGELAFAIQVESTDTGDPIVCPMVCCPYAEELAAQDETAADESTIELNAAETNEAAEQLAENESTYDEYYYEEDFYFENYGAEYGDEYAEVEEPTANEEMELNAPETSEDEHLSDATWENYAEDYADEYDYDYTDFGDDYESDRAATHEGDGIADCNDGCYGPVALPAMESTAGVCSEISDDDLVLEADSVSTETEEASDPYDRYGRQVGDEYAYEAEAEEAVEEYDDSYYEDYYYEDYYGEQFDEQVSSEEEATQTYEEDYERYYTEEYYEQLDEPVAETTEPAYEESYDSEYQDYYEDYYEDYYGEDYYDEYYEEAADSAEETNSDDDADWIDDYTSEYDAIYDKAVYGDAVEPIESARHDVPSPPVVDELCVQPPYADGECIDESNSLVIDDLPWADEICEGCEQDPQADVAEIDIPVDGVVSEYGSDYAEEYYEAYFDWVEEQEELAPAAEQEPADAEAAPCHAAACEASVPAAAATVRKTFDVQGFASYCGSRVAALTESLAELGRAVRTAAIELDTETR